LLKQRWTMDSRPCMKKHRGAQRVLVFLKISFGAFE
jgi:hypothetical protein